MEDAYHSVLPDPWDRLPAMARLLLQDTAVNGPERFFKIDTWHCLHLGCGKSWVAGSMMLIQSLFKEGNVDERVDVLSRWYRDFCRRESLQPYIRKIDKLTFGAVTTACEPHGTWNKASVTSNMLLFLESICEEMADQLQGDERLRMIAARPCFAVHVFQLACLSMTDGCLRSMGRSRSTSLCVAFCSTRHGSRLRRPCGLARLYLAS